MAEPRPTRMSEYYLNEYFKTHEKRMQESIQLAQSELQTRLKLLQYYDRQLKSLDEKKAVITKTRNERKKKVTKTQGVDKFKQEMSIAKQKAADDERAARAKERAEVSVNTDFDITRFDIGRLGKQMETELNAGSDQTLALDRAIANIGGATAGSSPLQRIILGKALLLQIDRAKRVVGGVPFDRSSAKATIASQLGIDAVDLDKPDATLKRQEIERRTVARTPSDLPTPGGGISSTTTTTFPAEETTTTKTGTDGKGTGDPTPEEEALLKDIVANRQRIEAMKKDVMDAIERDTGTDLDFERLLERGRDIYRRKYAPMSGAQRKAARQQEIIRGLTPTQKEMYQAFNNWRSGFASISPEAIDSIIERMNTPITDADSDAFKLAKQIVDQRKQGVEFPGGVYQHIQGLVTPGSDVDPDEVAAYVILQKKKPSTTKTMDQEIDEALSNAPGKVKQTFDALKALNEGMDIEGMTPEQKKIVVEKLKAQGIDAKILVDEKETPTNFQRFQKRTEEAAGQFGSGGQSQTDMGQFYSGGGNLFDQIRALPGNIQSILQFLSEQEKMTPGPPDMFTPTLPPVDEEEEEEKK
jgi:hypothetical protein